MPSHLNLEELVQDSRVHRRIYLEQEIFDLEMEHIFEANWVFVGHESEVAAAGDYKTVPIGTQPAIMTRDENGDIHLLMNRCMHRGSTICQEHRGNASTFRCWYHGWTYSNKGDLIGVPYADGYGASFDRRRFSLIKAARVEKYRGLVFASLNPEVAPLTDYLANARHYIDLFMELSPDGEVEARAGVHKYGYDGNWKFQMENGVDGYHPNFVHQAFFEAQGKGFGRKVMQLFTGNSEFESKDLGNGHSILDMAPRHRSAKGPVSNLLRGATSQASSDAYSSSMIRRYGEARTEEIFAASNVNLAIFPNLLIIGVQLRMTIPVSAKRTDVHLLPTTLKGVPDEINVARLRAHESFYGSAGGGAPDDVEMFNRCSDGLRVKGAEWLELSRGIERERTGGDGVVVGHITDETPQRAFYRRWKSLMCNVVAESQQPKTLRIARTI
ncbi:MAG: aromatic ring-hydroxylating dioxygenase subunit alpha [Candidatus Binatus sp.]|uniref:aromatic ring-hydroxylating oxygenase subunit alpha n=1 Tax=Candidatus Binatus sp. TaxID=2811406 RepID=UPI002716D796|nr:aromatic ring-hydroxylating dioxygenase subunit alpha [Candidatus Binatus sp.]MDO8431662.1 aromatic ring-hydroxylating dioxygenase subunit alpha [Candidatus Binatus sp.]